MEKLTENQIRILANSAFGWPPQPVEITTQEIVALKKYFKDENNILSDEIKKRLNAQ